ncbi:hypothetical protein BN3661_00048 [Eubacteriaceae bacterium CHKCI005]|nr:hypothetical protein BN3661_00048 [Eubacteriaceae bacterium CHKCI005]
MLNQLVYTRCFPHRDLKNQGQVVRNEGFGVFSMSPELFDQQDPESFDYLQARLAIKNGSNETSPIGLFHSYEYMVLKPGVYAFSFEYERPHCKTPRPNGKTHRSGTYMKQCLVGEIEGYPCEWFGSTTWDAHLKSENDYYLDAPPDAVPDYLPQVSEKPVGRKITMEKAAAFVRDGRKEAVKAAIWFLAHEYGKPEEERKVLLVKDTPENVELWIAAIEYAFSSKMARNISFNTNCSKLGMQTDNSLFYYTDASGKFYPVANRSLALKRHPYCMIVGYHPKDNYCVSLKPMPASNFVVLDGISKQVSFTPDSSISHPYYQAAVEYGEDIQDFCSYVLPSLSLTEVTPSLPQLYDAFQYLLDSNHKADTWKYSSTIAHINTLSQFGEINNDVLNGYLLDQALSVYAKMADEDEQNNLLLLQILWKLSLRLHREKDIIGIVADKLQYCLTHLSTSAFQLGRTWTALKSSSMDSLVAAVLDDLFNDTELSIYTKQLEAAGPEATDILLEMFFHTLRQNKMDLSAMMQNSTQYSFVCRSMVVLLKDKKRLHNQLANISSNSQVFNSMCISVADFLTKRNICDAAKWWDIVMAANGSDVVSFCRDLCRCGKVDIQLIEQLLTSRMASIGRCDGALYQAFREAIQEMGAGRDTGVQFYRKWIEVSQLEDAELIQKAVRNMRMSKDTEKTIFLALDSKLPYDKSSRLNPKIYGEMDAWAEGLGTSSRSSMLYRFQRAVEHKRSASDIIAAAAEILEACVVVDSNFCQQDYFQDIVEKLADFGDDSELHLTVLCLFEGSGQNFRYNYADCYLSAVLDHSKGRRLAENLMSLCEATTCKFTIPGRTSSQVKEVQDTTDDVLRDMLVHFYKPGLIDQILRLNQYDDAVKRKMAGMLEEAEKKGGKQGFAGRLTNKLGGLFGKRRDD